MYLPIGNDMAVRDRNVIGIFDLDNTTVTERGREFLANAEKEGHIVPWDARNPENLPASYILTVEYGMTRIYESTLASATLEKRMK